MCFAAKVTRDGSCPTFHKGQRLNTGERAAVVKFNGLSSQTTQFVPFYSVFGVPLYLRPAGF
jgi:hypothetical protein